MNVSKLSRLSFPELEILGIEKKNFDCTEVVSRYSDMGNDTIEEALGVETIGVGADPTVDFGWETNGGVVVRRGLEGGRFRLEELS